MTIIWDFRWLHSLLQKALKVVRKIDHTGERHDVEMSSVPDPSQAGESKSSKVVQSNNG
jgi:hypothetical protein